MYKLMHCGDRLSYSNRLWSFIIFISFPILLFLSWLGMSADEKKVYDGTVKYKFQDAMPDKHGDIYRIDKKLIVMFDAINDTKEINVTAETYLSVKQGDRVSFSMRDSEMGLESHWIQFLTFISLFFTIVSGLAFLVFVGMTSEHLYKNYRWVKVDLRAKKKRDAEEWWKKKVDPYGEEDWNDKFNNI